eukprot:1158467-Pelagomonas_calceolata.AAC.3
MEETGFKYDSLSRCNVRQRLWCTCLPSTGRRAKNVRRIAWTAACELLFAKDRIASTASACGELGLGSGI